MSDYIDEVSISGCGDEPLAAALNLALTQWWGSAHGNTVVGWHNDSDWPEGTDGWRPPNVLILSRGGGHAGDHQFPAALDAAQVAPLVQTWLAASIRSPSFDRERERTRYGQAPDTDGSASKGWQITTDWQAVTIRPHWVVFGK